MKLTDQQMWAIVCTSPAAGTTDLAQTLGISPMVVNRVRWRLRRDGWTCAVTYTTCRHCGQGLTNDLPINGRRTVHPQCLVAARPAISLEQNSERWATHAARIGRNAPLVDNMGSSAAEDDTVSESARHARRWTQQEDDWLIQRAAENTLAEMAEVLHRTVPSVSMRLQKLRQK